MYESFPEPVRRYFEFALTPGMPPVRTARLEQVGSMGPLRFRATELFQTKPIRLEWQAKVGVIRVLDKYESGTGSMCAKLFGFVSLVNQHGSGEMAEASLLRYLAEAAWFPTALLEVSWEGNRATLTDSGITVSAEFGFDSQGGIQTVSAVRFRAGKGMMPWRGEFRNYQCMGGMMIPTEAEVSWGSESPYWRGRIVRADFNSSGAQSATA